VVTFFQTAGGKRNKLCCDETSAATELIAPDKKTGERVRLYKLISNCAQRYNAMKVCLDAKQTCLDAYTQLLCNYEHGEQVQYNSEAQEPEDKMKKII